MAKRVGRKRKRSNIVDNDIRRWSDLPNELLQSIKKRLFYSDQCRFTAVCKSWNSIEEDERNKITPLQQMPWILVFDENHPCKLVDSMYKKEYTMNMKSIQKKMNIKSFSKLKVHESKYGWLLISLQNKKPFTTRLFLYSPFFSDYKNNKNFIELPRLNFDIYLASISSNPLDDDWTVVTLNTSFDKNTILVRTYVRGQSSWSSQFFNCDFSWDVKRWIYSEGIFYYTTYSRQVGAFDLAEEDWKVYPLPPFAQSEFSFRKLYMVKPNNNELFLIMEDSLSKPKKRWSCPRNQICRLDLLSVTWESLSSIGDRVLFIGDGYNCFLNSSVLKLNGEQEGISDTIYYCSGHELRCCAVDVFTDRNANYAYEYSGRQTCARHYGQIATRKQCRKLLIDPPSSSSSLCRVSGNS